MLYVNKANETMAPNLISARLVFSTGVIFPISSIPVLLVIFKRDCCLTVAKYLYSPYQNYHLSNISELQKQIKLYFRQSIPCYFNI